MVFEKKKFRFQAKKTNDFQQVRVGYLLILRVLLRPTHAHNLLRFVERCTKKD